MKSTLVILLQLYPALALEIALRRSVITTIHKKLILCTENLLYKFYKKKNESKQNTSGSNLVYEIKQRLRSTYKYTMKYSCSLFFIGENSMQKLYHSTHSIFFIFLIR